MSTFHQRPITSSSSKNSRIGIVNQIRIIFLYLIGGLLTTMKRISIKSEHGHGINIEGNCKECPRLGATK
jgi:hypothetical protein